VFSNKLDRHDKLLLAFDALVISKVLGRSHYSAWCLAGAARRAR
jgi:hypothetical protein